MKILVLPDSHAKPKISNRRFTWFGRLAKDIKADVVLSIGDLYDLESLSHYDKGKTGFEGRRLKADIAVGHDAFQKMEDAGGWAKGKRPRLVALLGNHEHRLARLMDSEPALDGLFSMQDLQAPKWEQWDFLKPVTVEGITFCHYFTTGIMGRPQAGEHPAANLIKKQLQSCVQGHSHIFDYSERTNARGKKVQGLVVGCALDPLQKEDYAGEQGNALWHKGVVELDVEDGYFDFRTISMNKLEKTYGR